MGVVTTIPKTPTAPTYRQSKGMTDAQKSKILNIRIATMSLSTLAGIGAVVYNIKTGGGFWRGVGYFVLASVVVGFPIGVIGNTFIAKELNKE